MPWSLWIDGSIVGVYLLVTMVVGILVRKYVRGVDDFLVAGREMKLFLGIASLAATEFGIGTCMSAAENGYKFGFAGATPGLLTALAMLLVGVTGFGVKPLRDAGVVTLPELFQKRFGSRVRWASGVVIVLGGLLNMGVFLRAGGEFLVLICGQNPEAIKQTHYLELTMTVLLIAVAVYTILGGMLSVLVTDFLQFVVMSFGLIAVTLLILYRIGWGTLVTAVEMHHGAGGFNPFQNEELGWTFVVFNTLISLSAVLTWQTIIQRVLVAKDTRTGLQVYKATSFFFVCRFLLPGIWGIAALATLTPEQVGPNSQHAMPVFLSTFVPVGLMGILVAAMLAADMSTDSSYMLAWASVIYNDILAPFRKGWSQKKGLFWNRTLVALIGLFLLGYGLWYPLQGPLWNYLTVTGTIYLSSMSVLLIACCYWKPANDWGATAAIAVGAMVPISYLVLEQVPATAESVKQIGSSNFGIATFVLAALAMVLGSLLKPSRPQA